MPTPVVIPRADHPISRRDIDPDALKVLYRLHQNQHAAYLVGGSVRDLLLGRRPKDFDIGTDAHPNQIKRLFRNCWIIGRRFRLAHIKFGQKTIEVATFRRYMPEAAAGAQPEPDPVVVASAAPEGAEDHRPGIIHRDNTFGTAEEDAFRRDFTINGLFYDISTHSVIDYVGGLSDLERRVIRSIGDPNVRFVEDPVRMFRAVVFAARLGFDLDDLVIDAIARHRALILEASPARLLEEYYKILRSGYAEASFRALGRARLLELVTPELKSPPPALWASLEQLDRYRQQLPAAPPELTNTILVGTLLGPLGALEDRKEPAAGATPRRERIAFGLLPVAKKDFERLRQLAVMLPRMTESDLPPRVVRSISHRPGFPDALTWLSIFGDSPEHVERWTQGRAGRGEASPAGAEHGADDREVTTVPPKRRRRRRRRGRRRGESGSGSVPPATA